MLTVVRHTLPDSPPEKSSPAIDASQLGELDPVTNFWATPWLTEVVTITGGPDVGFAIYAGSGPASCGGGPYPSPLDS
jgi:hypothetical protein